jgi:hypothetical protein
VNEATVGSLLAEVQAARQAMRRQDGASAVELLERRYAEIRLAMDWEPARARTEAM